MGKPRSLWVTQIYGGWTTSRSCPRRKLAEVEKTAARSWLVNLPAQLCLGRLGLAPDKRVNRASHGPGKRIPTAEDPLQIGVKRRQPVPFEAL